MLFFFFFKQKTAYEMRISDWSSDVCSSDLPGAAQLAEQMIGKGAVGLGEELLGALKAGMKRCRNAAGLRRCAKREAIEAARRAVVGQAALELRHRQQC